MGHREKMKGGPEYDAFTGWKKVLNWRPGVRAWIKRKFWKRQRMNAKAALAGEKKDG